MTPNPTPTRTAGRRAGRRGAALTLPALATGLVLLLAGCAGADPSASAATPTQQAEGSDDGSDDGTAPQVPRGGGALVGEIASVGAAVLQVRGADEQTAVTWSTDTAITQTVAAALTDVTVGACVTAVAAPQETDDATGSTSDDAADDTTPLQTTSVTVVAAADDGTCTTGGGFGPGGGDRPDGAPTDLPSGMPTDGPRFDGGELPDGAPTDAPSGAPGDGQRSRMLGGAVTGQVTAVAGTTITVGVRGADGTQTSRDVVVSGTTTYSRTADADATALVAGRCAVVRGEADDSGKVAATSIAVSDAGDDGCTSTLGGFAMRGGPGGVPGQDRSGQGSGQGSGQDDDEESSTDA
jgi:hypothetical protein